jgi:hypothetical protein
MVRGENRNQVNREVVYSHGRNDKQAEQEEVPEPLHIEGKVFNEQERGRDRSKIRVLSLAVQEDKGLKHEEASLHVV